MVVLLITSGDIKGPRGYPYRFWVSLDASVPLVCLKLVCPPHCQGLDAGMFITITQWLVRFYNGDVSSDGLKDVTCDYQSI